MEKVEILKLKREIYKTVRDAIVFNDVKHLDEEIIKLEAKIEGIIEANLEILAQPEIRRN